MENEFIISKVKANKETIKIFNGIIISFTITIILLFIYASILVYTNVSENTIKPVILFISTLSIMIGSFLSSLKLKKRGIINGVIVGIGYCIIIYILSSLWLVGFQWNMYSVLFIILSAIIGAIGGIIGVNMG